MDAPMLSRAENTAFVPEPPHFFESSIPGAPSQRFLHYVVSVLVQAGKLTAVRGRVLELALLGRQYGEIAEILGKSPNTVASQVKAILDALGADSTRDLFRIFLNEVDRLHQVQARRSALVPSL